MVFVCDQVFPVALVAYGCMQGLSCCGEGREAVQATDWLKSGSYLRLSRVCGQTNRIDIGVWMYVQ